MCWYSIRPQKTKKAKRNIKVLKVLIIEGNNPKILIPYYRAGVCVYKLNKEMPLVPIRLNKKYITIKRNSRVEKSLCHSIHKGYHSYKIDSEYTIDDSRIVIHHIGYYNSEYFKLTVCLTECIIPKGTRYFLNEHGEYVSEKIIVKRIIKKAE